MLTRTQRPSPFLGIFIGVIYFISIPIYSQVSSVDSCQTARKNIALGATATTYATSMVLLYDLWYKDIPNTQFHFYNDWNEWNNMDKVGHIFATYTETQYAHLLYKWAGFNEKKSLNMAAASSLIFQTSVEVFDGFSADWGFSIIDMTSNLLGASLYYFQEKWWSDQRIMLKYSGLPPNYRSQFSDLSSSNIQQIENVATDLYGRSFFSKTLKDYNGQTIWLSVNVASFLPKSTIPNWLNVAIGYGSNHMFGGYNNDRLGSSLSHINRYQQYYISPDINLRKIKTKSKFLRTTLDILSVIKIPLPTIEYNSNNELIWHWIFF